MNKFLVAFAFAASVAAPALAAAPPSSAADQSGHFQADGMTFDFVQVADARGSLITGRDSDGKSFRLRVVGTVVRGDYAGTPLRFRIAAPISTREVASLD